LPVVLGLGAARGLGRRLRLSVSLPGRGAAFSTSRSRCQWPETGQTAAGGIRLAWGGFAPWRVLSTQMVRECGQTGITEPRTARPRLGETEDRLLDNLYSVCRTGSLLGPPLGWRRLQHPSRVTWPLGPMKATQRARAEEGLLFLRFPPPTAGAALSVPCACVVVQNGLPP